MLSLLTRLGRNGTALACAAWLLAVAPSQLAAEEAGSGAAGAERCRECHDYGPPGHVEGLLQGSHSISEEAGFVLGCEDCHGASAPHAEAPREVSPANSYGPRWPASGAAQDLPCLNCHEPDTHKDWQHSLHMLNDLTCVSCHDIHAEVDRILLEEQQAEVCTRCHEGLDKGIHGLEGVPASDPPCATCHNPHNHETAGPQMQANDSAGCRHCHDLKEMANDPLVSTMAKAYHQAMRNSGRTCLECHQGIAHPGSGKARPAGVQN